MPNQKDREGIKERKRTEKVKKAKRRKEVRGRRNPKTSLAIAWARVAGDAVAFMRRRRNPKIPSQPLSRGT